VAERVGTASGKLILCGEHAVVYGYPAIAFAVGLGVTVRARPAPESVIPGADHRLQDALRLLPGGWHVDIESTLPTGCGMGSSAALSVAMVRAILGESSAEETFERAMPLEQIFHGNPSGLDVAVSARGGSLRYVKGRPFQSLPPVAGKVVVFDTGHPGPTKELVAHVGSQRPGCEPTLQAIADIVDRAETVLNNPAELGPLLTQNHELLASLGVSTPQLDAIVRSAVDAGAFGAKLSGAGGGGVVMALTDDPAPLLALAPKLGIRAFEATPQEVV